jgi:hypothetical protein
MGVHRQDTFLDFWSSSRSRFGQLRARRASERSVRWAEPARTASSTPGAPRPPPPDVQTRRPRILRTARSTCAVLPDSLG